MIVRRTGAWGAMSGERTEDDSIRKGIGMSGLQHQKQQQVKAVESSWPGSSDSSSSGGSGWGTCSELLLVSAVKKHGVPNWSRVASELKARAVVLNISPSCLTEEACKFKYNALKGKFASSSSSGGGGSVSSPDDDLDGVSWFEELRKLRMSHLKEELQVYDSSIGHLQSRISKLQEERAGCLSTPPLMKQFDCSCRVMGTNSTDCNSPEMKAPSPMCRSEESLETSQDSALNNAAQAAPPGENPPLNTGDVDQLKSCGMDLEESEDQEAGPTNSSPPQPTGHDFTDEVERRADLTSGQGVPSESHPPSPEKVADPAAGKAEDQVVPTASCEKALQEPGDEIMRDEEPDVETSTSTSHQAVVVKPSEDPREIAADVNARGDAVDPAVADDFAMAANEPIEGFDEKTQKGKDSESGVTASISYPPPSSPSTSTVFNTPEDLLPGRDTPVGALGVPGVDSPSRAAEAEADASVSGDAVGKDDSIPKRESWLSRLGLSYGRTEKESRKKANEEAQLNQMSRPEQVREVDDDRPSERSTEEVAHLLSADEEKDMKDTSAFLDQSQNGKISPSETSPMDEAKVDAVADVVVAVPLAVQPTEQDVVPDSPTPVIDDVTDNGVQFSGLANVEINLADADAPSGMEGLQTGSDLLSSKAAEPSSPDDDMPLLTVALGPDLDDDAEPEPEPKPSPPVVAPTTSGISPNPESSQAVSHVENNLKFEMDVAQGEIPNEVKSASGGAIPGIVTTDGRSEDVVLQEVDEVMMKSETVEAEGLEKVEGQEEEVDEVMMKSETVEAEGLEKVEGQEEEAEAVAKVDEVETVVTEGEDGETLATADQETSRSAGEDVAEPTLDMKGSENGADESRDGLETVDVQQQPLFPEYTDSQIDKSEVGSSMDSVEDMSPSNRKNRREPKVPGKFLPLLECLRVICAHKFAPLFRQRQDFQYNNSRYERLVRRHVDLGMVRARLEDGAYSGSVEFFRDLLLIFTNALVYNSSDSQEYIGAKALRSCALTEMGKILQTEALLKQNGPATRKREGRKSMEVHKARVSSSSPGGSEVRKKGILKGSSHDAPASALDNNNSQGGAKSAHIAFEDTHAERRSSNNNSDVDRDLDAKIEPTFKKAAASRIVKEEATPRKESQRPEFLNESVVRTAGGGPSGKKVKVERGDAHKTGLQGHSLADLRAGGGRLNVESIRTKTTPPTAKTKKDVICIDLEKRGTSNNFSSVVLSSGLPVEKQRTAPLVRQPSTSRVSRYSKRGGDSGTSSNPKKRVRK